MEGAGFVLSYARRAMVSGNCTRAAGCGTNSRISKKRSLSLRGIEEVAATRTGSGAQIGTHYYKLVGAITIVRAGCPDSGPSGFGSLLGTQGLAVTEPPSLKICL